MIDRLHTPNGLVLRPWHDSDVDAVLTAFAPAEMARQAGTPIDTPGAARRWLRARHDERQAAKGYTWAVTDAAGAVLGNAAVTSVERRHDTGWVSYWTTPQARGRGVATAAVRALAAWAFADLGLYRLELGHRTNNPASCRVATAAGFPVEGLERKKLRYDGERFDVELHARLVTDPG